MQYKYEYEIAACVVMIIIALHCFFVKQYPTIKSRVFLAALWASIIESVFNIASSIGLANTGVVPEIVNEGLAFAFFAAEGAVSYLLFYYVIWMCDFELEERRRVFILANIPFLLFEIMVLLTPFIGFFYYFEDNTYYQGFGTEFGYAYIGYYYILNMVIIAIQRKKVTSRMKGILFFYTFCAVLSLWIQHTSRGIVLTGAANAVILFLVYLMMQNPGEYLDVPTGTGNGNALKMQMQQLIDQKKRFRILSIRLSNLDRVQALLGEDSAELLRMEIGHYLVNLCGYLKVFHHKEDIFEIIMTDKDNEEELLQRLEERFDDSWKVQNNYVYADAVMGIQHYPSEFEDVTEFHALQQFLFKHAKKNHLHRTVNDAELLETFKRRKNVEFALKRALEKRTLQIYFQPIYSLREKKIVSLEALTRLEDEYLGFIPPDEFIAVAEHDGSIVEIGEYVIEECCRFLAKKVLSNDSLDIRSIQINISVVQCMQQNLKEKVIPILEKYHIPPSMITLEITESTEIQATELMLRQMEEMNAAGIQFAADDYGTGNSNFSYLVKFPFREIKIDKNMTWAYFESATARVIIENEIKTMVQLGIPVVAEGVETQEQSDALEALGVNYIQGYYYGRPMPENDCLVHLREFAERGEMYGR